MPRKYSRHKESEDRKRKRSRSSTRSHRRHKKNKYKSSSSESSSSSEVSSSDSYKSEKKRSKSGKSSEKRQSESKKKSASKEKGTEKSEERGSEEGGAENSEERGDVLLLHAEESYNNSGRSKKSLGKRRADDVEQDDNDDNSGKPNETDTDQVAFNLQTEYLEELIERVLRGKMKALDLKQMLLDDVVTSSTSSKPVNRSSDTGFYDDDVTGGPSDRPHIIASLSYSERGTAGPDAYGAGSTSDFDLYSNTSRRSCRSSKSGDSIDEAISLSSEDSFGKSKKSKKKSKEEKRTTKHERRQRPLSPPKYLFTLDMDKDLLTALRRKVFRIIENLPEEAQLSIENTFESQRKLVNGTLIPTIQASLDHSTYPVDDNIIYDILHERHRHRRESYLLGLRSQKEQDEQARRRHKNARAREKRLRQARIIDKLRNERDGLIKKFSRKELQPILDDNRFHSQEESETDPDNLEGSRRILIKDLRWRSSTARKFLRDYVDRTFNESSNALRSRKRVYDDKQINEKAPSRAPRWTLSGYDGSLKKYVDDYCKNWCPEIQLRTNQQTPDNQQDKESDEEEDEEEENNDSNRQEKSNDN